MSTPNPFTEGPPPLPPIEPQIPPANFRESGKAISDGLADGKFSAGFWGPVFDKLTDMLAEGAVFLIQMGFPVLLRLLRWYRKFREGVEPEISEIASTAVGDLFGVEIDSEAFSKLGPRATRKQLGDILGAQILKGITGTSATAPGGTVEPSDVPAEQFLSTMADLAVEGWFENFLSGLASEQPLEKLGELKDVVAKVFGFGRVSARILGPYISVLVNNPTQWNLNKKYRPTMLTEAQLVRQYLRGTLTRAALDEALARLGHSAGNIAELIDAAHPQLSPAQLVRQFQRGRTTIEDVNRELGKRGYTPADVDVLVNESTQFIGVSDLAFLVRNKTWTTAQAVAELRNQGYDDRTAGVVLEVERLKRTDAAKQAVISTARGLYIDRFIDGETFRGQLDRAGVEPEVALWIEHEAGLIIESRAKRISESDAEHAVLRGFWTMTEYTSFLRELGYASNDVLTKQLLISDTIAQDAEAQKKRDDAAKQRTAAEQARAIAAAARQAELEARRNNPQLTISQVAQATVRGDLTLTQYTAFLTKQGYAPADVALLSDLVSGERSDYASAAERRAVADQKLAVTTLTTSKLEHAVMIGAIPIDDYRKTLTDQGVDTNDVDLLVKTLVIDMGATATAIARRTAISDDLSSRGISLDQMEHAVKLGVSSLPAYSDRLATLGYSIEDQAMLSAVLRNQISKDATTSATRDQANAAGAAKGIPLASLAAAVKKNIRAMSDYRAALLQLGYSASDAQLMVDLLQSDIDAAGVAGDRKSQIDAIAAAAGISLPDIERMVSLGMLDLAYYQDILTSLNLPAEDQQVLVFDLESRAADIDADREAGRRVSPQLTRVGTTLADLDRGLRSGTRVIYDVRATLALAGADPAAIDQIADLSLEQLQQYRYATARRTQLNAMRTPQELTRATMENAVRAKLTTLDEYTSWLSQNGYSAEDQATLVQIAIDETV